MDLVETVVHESVEKEIKHVELNLEMEHKNIDHPTHLEKNDKKSL